MGLDGDSGEENGNYYIELRVWDLLGLDGDSGEENENHYSILGLYSDYVLGV